MKIGADMEVAISDEISVSFTRTVLIVNDYQ